MLKIKKSNGDGSQFYILIRIVWLILWLAKNSLKDACFWQETPIEIFNVLYLSNPFNSQWAVNKISLKKIGQNWNILAM